QPNYASGFQRPLTSFTITSTFGPRVDPTGFAGDYHDGLDMAAPGGTPIMASRAGTVIASEYHYSAGNHVIIQHDNGYYTYYMHMNAPGIAAGSKVNAGDIIGNVGTTGSSTGDHLHFGISTGVWSGFMDPAPFIGL
ncbi:MAG: M23 family metallopeptidase, partial [Vagococcus fluvialis]